MDYSTTDIIEFPIASVFAAHRDHLTDLVEFLPNVESITIESREATGEILRLVNTWKAAQTEVPSLLRPIVKPDLLQWIDRAEWNGAEYHCHFNIELGFLKDAIACKGINRMETTADGHTAVTIEGAITVDAKKIPGVPKFMAKKIGAALEKFIVKLITPNLKKTNDGVRSFLEAQARP